MVNKMKSDEGEAEGDTGCSENQRRLPNRGGGQEQAEGQFPGTSGQVWIPVLPHSVCVTWNKLPNLSVPRFLIDNMGVLIAPT